MFYEYEKKDYLFKDLNGNEYISTPEANWFIVIFNFTMTMFLGIIGIASSFWMFLN